MQIWLAGSSVDRFRSRCLGFGRGGTLVASIDSNAKVIFALLSGTLPFAAKTEWAHGDL